VIIPLLVVFVLASAVLFYEYKPMIALKLNQFYGFVKVCGSADIKLPQVCLDDYDKIYVSNGLGTEVKELESVNRESFVCITNWILSAHNDAIKSYSDFSGDYRITLIEKGDFQYDKLSIVTILNDFAVIYDYGTNQYLRLITKSDRVLIEAVKKALKEDYDGAPSRTRTN
jgi:hypothetical protein